MKGCYIIVLVVERYENKTQGYALLAQLVEQRTLNPVSYTHLDVYKRQIIQISWKDLMESI